MALTTFPTGDLVIPTVGSGYDRSFRMLSAGFGEGFEQRSQDGINTVKETWRVSWRDIPTATAVTIKTFLNLRGTVEAFLWTPPAGTQLKVVMRKGYKETYNKTENVSTIATTFEQVFDV